MNIEEPRSPDECTHVRRIYLGIDDSGAGLSTTYPRTPSTNYVQSVNFHFCPVCGIDFGSIEAWPEEEWCQPCGAYVEASVIDGEVECNECSTVLFMAAEPDRMSLTIESINQSAKESNMKASIEVEVSMTDLLSAVWDAIDGSYSPWIKSYSFDFNNNDGTESVTINFLDPDGYDEGTIKTQAVSPEALLESFSQMVGRQIWGSIVTIEPGNMDSLQADHCLQVALFGEVVYS
jgi:hypothetical protein